MTKDVLNSQTTSNYSPDPNIDVTVTQEDVLSKLQPVFKACTNYHNPMDPVGIEDWEILQ